LNNPINKIAETCGKDQVDSISENDMVTQATLSQIEKEID